MKNLFNLNTNEVINIWRLKNDVIFKGKLLEKGDWEGEITIMNTKTNMINSYHVYIKHELLMKSCLEKDSEVEGLYLNPSTDNYEPCKISMVADLSPHMLIRFKKRATKKVAINEESYRFDKISDMNEHDCSFIHTLAIIGYMYNIIPEVYIKNKDYWAR